MMITSTDTTYKELKLAHIIWAYTDVRSTDTYKELKRTPFTLHLWPSSTYTTYRIETNPTLRKLYNPWRTDTTYKN